MTIKDGKQKDADRRAAALRENLRKRKLQAEQRQSVVDKKNTDKGQ